MKSFLCILASFLLLLGPVSASKKPITIGLIHFSAPLSPDMDFEPTLKHLQRYFAPRQVDAKVYSSADLEEAVKRGTVDFFYASSGFFYRMLPFGARDLATVVTTAKAMPNFGTAGVFITRKDRSDIKTFEDMKGKVLAANYPSAFHGYRIGMAELEYRGYSHEHFFKHVDFVGESAEKILKEVIDGKADVGFIRACWLEEHEHQNIAVMDKLRAIDPKPGPIACLHSTRAYPNNTFAVTYKVNPDLARQMAVALLSMKPGADGQSWSVATDFKPVDDLYRVLKTGPYEYLRQWSVKRVLREFWPLFVIALLAVLGLIIHSWRAQKLVERATNKLIKSQKVQREILAKSQALSEKMELQQKINLVGQLSSMFAHEMNQPLAASRYFVDGLKALRKQNGRADPKMIDFSLEQLEKELKRASQIVNKVRDYARKTMTREAKVDLSRVLEEIVETLTMKFDGKVSVEKHIEKDVFIEGDAVEVEILCWNLLKNAMEESLEVRPSEVWLKLNQSGNAVSLQIQNTGRELTETEVSNLGNQVFKTTKNEGLGLGLTVVSSILEAMNGSISFNVRKGGGLNAEVELKPWKKDA